MRELKADKTFVFGEECEAYKKSEADKVIAEKDAKIVQLEALIENYNRISGEIIDNANYQKYKRCLAMASLSLEKRDCYKALYEKANYDKWALKWYKRWLSIAEKFKEAK